MAIAGPHGRKTAALLLLGVALAVLALVVIPFYLLNRY